MTYGLKVENTFHYTVVNMAVCVKLLLLLPLHSCNISFDGQP